MNIILLSLGMMLVTYIPRLLPLVLLKDIKLPKKIRLFLSFIPYAAMGALLIPGGLNAIEGDQLASVIGLLAAVAAAWLLKNFTLTIITSILVVCLYILIGG